MSLRQALGDSGFRDQELLTLPAKSRPLMHVSVEFGPQDEALAGWAFG